MWWILPKFNICLLMIWGATTCDSLLSVNWLNRMTDPDMVNYENWTCHKLARYRSLSHRFFLYLLWWKYSAFKQSPYSARLVQRQLAVGTSPKSVNGCFKEFPQPFFGATHFLFFLPELWIRNNCIFLFFFKSK